MKESMSLFKAPAHASEAAQLQRAVSDLQQCLTTVLKDVREALEPTVVHGSSHAKA